MSEYDLDADVPTPEADGDAPSVSLEQGEPTEQAAFADPYSANAIAADPASSLPPWHVPGTDWNVGPTWSGSTDDTYDNKQNKDRAEQQRDDERRGRGDPKPSEWWKPKPLDLTLPDNPFTPEAQAEIKRKQQEKDREREEERRKKEEEMKKMMQDAIQEQKETKQQLEPEEPGDYPMPPDDPSYT
jgi:hypothetical protein